ncbi:g8266 [Coccomyxa elongata]
MSAAGKEGNDSGASGLYFGTPDARDRVPCKRIAAYTAIVISVVISLLLFGGCYRYNVHLKRQLADARQTIEEQQRRALGRLKDQLASETLILREQLLRTKSDNRGADNALANAQEDLAAALSRAQACEEAYEPLFAELESLKVQIRTADGGISKGGIDDTVNNLGGVQAAEVLRDQAASSGVQLRDFITFEHKKQSGN